MLKKIVLVFAFITNSLFASSHSLDFAALSKMKGCYKVSYKFEELESLQEGYDKKNGVYAEEAKEFIDYSYEGHRISLQHILMVGSHVIKHWSQEWEYSPSYIFDYSGKKTWIKRKLKPSPFWIQKVYSIDDSLRYQGLGLWKHEDEFSIWESVSFSPLPRREYTKRSDYHVLERQNIHRVFENQWTHEQENKKMIKTEEGSFVPLALERGFNRYKAIHMDECKGAQKWWLNKKQAWNIVKKSWSQLFDKTSKIQVRDLEGRSLSREINKLVSKYYGFELEVDQQRELLEKSTDLLREWLKIKELN